MRRISICLAVVVGTLAAAAPAMAEPDVFASARDGDLLVSSSILVFAKGADMRGGWVDESIGCDQFRRLNVSIIVERVPFHGRARIVRKDKSRIVGNCAEGGPNMGFAVKARGIGMGCADGRWKPGRYSFATTTEFDLTGLEAIASLGWTTRRAC
jgi:hypothetical protein